MQHREETVSPEAAISALAAAMDAIETSGALSCEKEVFLERMTHLLRTAATITSPLSYQFFRSDPHFQKLRIGNKYLIENSFDRDLHERVIRYLESVGIPTTNEDRSHIEQFFDARDIEKRRATFASYAQHGLLTLKAALEKGVVQETSATPGDFSSRKNLHEVPQDDLNNVRGYALTPGDLTDALFYGRNSFFHVVMERGGEEIDRAGKLPKREVENRLRNSMVLVVKAGNLDVSSRTENVYHEDVVDRDIPPEAIAYVIVDAANLSLAQEAFGHVPASVIGAESVEASIDGLYDGPYTLPDYKGRIEEIARAEGSIWCHIARLPVDTYPKTMPSKE